MCWMRSALRAGALGMAALALASAPAYAQGGGGGRGGGRGMMLTPAMMSRLELTPDQQQKMAKAREALMSAMQQSRGLSPEDRRAAMMAATQDYRNAVDGILTAQQKQRLEALRAEAAEYRELGPIGGQLAFLNPPLNADQKAKVKAIAAKYAPERERLRGGQGQQRSPEARQQMRELSQKIFEEVRAVLTAEQQKQLQQPGAGFGGGRGGGRGAGGNA
jgi:Spy/CpxP family protein refolding chaperone